MDGRSFTSIGDFSLNGVIIGSVKTFYFKPVYAKFIRIVVKQGTPNIKFEFYFSAGTVKQATSTSNSSTFIAKTVSASLDEANGGMSTCGETGLCWAGVEACQPRNLSGFSLLYANCTSNDFIQAVKIDYSLDGITFTCWNNCKEVALDSNSSFAFPSPLLA
jgi:hypothetical protein